MSRLRANPLAILHSGREVYFIDHRGSSSHYETVSYAAFPSGYQSSPTRGTDFTHSPGVLQAVLPKSSGWSDFSACGDWPGSRLTQNRGKSPEPDTEQLDKVFSPCYKGWHQRDQIGSMHNPAKAVVELSQKTRRLLACDTITKFAEGSI